MVGQRIGEINNLDASLRELLEHYRPGELGVGRLSDVLQITLPLDLWPWFSWLEEGTTPSLSAGLGADQTIFTVPGNERIWLDYVMVQRASGDNTTNHLELTYPPGYFGGQAEMRILNFTGTTLIYWPDPSAAQSPTYHRPGPVLLEPETVVQFGLDGAGASASTFTYYLAMRRCKLVRALPPS